MASFERYNNIGPGHYTIAGGATWHRFGFGIALDWFRDFGGKVWTIDLSLDFLFFWFNIGYSGWHIKEFYK